MLYPDIIKHLQTNWAVQEQPEASWETVSSWHTRQIDTVSTVIHLWRPQGMCTVSEDAWSDQERTTARFAGTELFWFLFGNDDRVPTHAL